MRLHSAADDAATPNTAAEASGRAGRDPGCKCRRKRLSSPVNCVALSLADPETAAILAAAKEGALPDMAWHSQFLEWLLAEFGPEMDGRWVRARPSSS